MSPHCTWRRVLDTCAGRYVTCGCGWFQQCWGMNESRRLHNKHLWFVRQAIRP